MQDQIICPECKKPIPLSQAITHQIDEKYRKELEEERKKTQIELEAQKQKADEERQKLISMAQKRIEEEKQKTAKEVEDGLRKKITNEMEFKMKNAQNESEELHKQNKNLQEQLLELTKSLRKLQSDNEQKQIELEKKLIEEQQRIREEEQKRMDEQYRLRVLEKEKQLQDAIKVNEDLRRKLEQGSQQTQGEILELELENQLKKQFPHDEIKPVPKGITGADIVQIVRNSYGRVCGTIMWETKRTKAWSNEWVTKLKDDQRSMKAEVAVIVTQTLPQTVKRFGLQEGVWVCDYECMIGTAYALRSKLLEIAAMKSTSEGKKDKMEMVYNYFSGTEFKQRIEGILEAFDAIQKDIEVEKRWYAQKWAKQEKNLRRVFDNTLGMQGEVQSILGNTDMEALPEGYEEQVLESDKEEKTDDENQTLFS